MKRTSIFKTALLMITLTVFYVFPAFASESLIGSLDVFDASQITGWVYDANGTTTAPEIQIKITDSSTGKLVKELPVSPTYKRNDLISHVGENGTPGFIVSVDLTMLPDGSYAAAAYKDGRKFTNTIYYAKGNAAALVNGAEAHSLGVFRLTAYCPCRSCSEGWGSLTSSGAIAASSHTVAVDPRVIPIGSRLLIDGTIYTAEDIGGAVKNNHIDIFFDSHGQARQFGTRTAQVYLLQ